MHNDVVLVASLEPLHIVTTISLMYFLQRSVASSSKRATIRFADLKRRRYWFPLMVDWFVLKSDWFSNAGFFILGNFRSILVLMLMHVLQVGIGLLVLQQLSGINGILFYSSNIFESAG